LVIAHETDLNDNVDVAVEGHDTLPGLLSEPDADSLICTTAGQGVPPECETQYFARVALEGLHERASQLLPYFYVPIVGSRKQVER
jgi:hypothetical protein